jgi:hypothetical protein
MPGVGAIIEAAWAQIHEVWFAILVSKEVATTYLAEAPVERRRTPKVGQILFAGDLQVCSVHNGSRSYECARKFPTPATMAMLHAEGWGMQLITDCFAKASALQRKTRHVETLRL